MRGIIVIFCLFVFTQPALADRLPRHLKTPKACKVIKVTGESGEKQYTLTCKKPLAKRMRGWVFLHKTRFHKQQAREWVSRRDNWRLVEESRCRLKTCKVRKVTVFKIIGCQHLSNQNPFL